MSKAITIKAMALLQAGRQAKANFATASYGEDDQRAVLKAALSASSAPTDEQDAIIEAFKPWFNASAKRQADMKAGLLAKIEPRKRGTTAPTPADVAAELKRLLAAEAARAA